MPAPPLSSAKKVARARLPRELRARSGERREGVSEAAQTQQAFGPSRRPKAEQPTGAMGTESVMGEGPGTSGLMLRDCYHPHPRAPRTDSDFFTGSSCIKRRLFCCTRASKLDGLMGSETSWRGSRNFAHSSWRRKRRSREAGPQPWTFGGPEHTGPRQWCHLDLPASGSSWAGTRCGG